MPEAIINTDFGHIRVTYSTTDELNAALQDIEEQAQSISKAASKVIPVPPRLPKPGYEGAYRFLSSGKLELLIYQMPATQLTALALFAYHPEMVSRNDLAQITAVEDIYNKVLKQTNNKKYFRRTDDDMFGLSDEGFDFFMENVKPIVDAASKNVQAPDGEEP